MSTADLVNGATDRELRIALQLAVAHLVDGHAAPVVAAGVRAMGPSPYPEIRRAELLLADLIDERIAAHVLPQTRGAR